MIRTWRNLALCLLLVIGINGLALLLIPQLSLRAAVRGTSIALLAVFGQQLALRWQRRRRERQEQQQRHG